MHKQTNTICIGHHYAHTNKHNMYWTPLCTHKQTQYVLDTTIIHIVLVCLCIVVSNTYCACLCVHSGVQYILCLFVCLVVSNTYCVCLFVHSNMYWTPLCTNKQTQYVLDTTMHKQTNTICVGHHYAQTNKHNMCWTPLYWCPTHIVFVCLCRVVSNTYCVCLFV
jgi:hypothetical protein